MPFEKIEWDQLVINGHPLFSQDQADDIMRQFQDYPDSRPQSEQIMTVQLLEQSPASPRDAAIRVGQRSWPLQRKDNSTKLDDRTISLPTIYTYSVTGDVAEEILSALETPSNVLVTATLVTQSAGSTATNDSASTSQDAATMHTDTVNSHVGIVVATNSTSEATTQEHQAGIRRAYKRAPEPVLRFDTRSTNLARTIDDYRSCYTTND